MCEWAIALWMTAFMAYSGLKPMEIEWALTGRSGDLPNGVTKSFGYGLANETGLGGTTLVHVCIAGNHFIQIQEDTSC